MSSVLYIVALIILAFFLGWLVSSIVGDIFSLTKCLKEPIEKEELLEYATVSLPEILQALLNGEGCLTRSVPFNRVDIYFDKGRYKGLCILCDEENPHRYYLRDSHTFNKVGIGLFLLTEKEDD